MICCPLLSTTEELMIMVNVSIIKDIASSEQWSCTGLVFSPLRLMAAGCAHACAWFREQVGQCEVPGFGRRLSELRAALTPRESSMGSGVRGHPEADHWLQRRLWGGAPPGDGLEPFGEPHGLAQLELAHGGVGRRMVCLDSHEGHLQSAHPM